MKAESYLSESTASEKLSNSVVVSDLTSLLSNEIF